MTVTQTRTGQYTAVHEPTGSDQIIIDQTTLLPFTVAVSTLYNQLATLSNPLICHQRPKTSPFAGLGFVSTTASCNGNLPLTATQTLSSGLSLQHLLAIDKSPKALGLAPAFASLLSIASYKETEDPPSSSPPQTARDFIRYQSDHVCGKATRCRSQPTATDLDYQTASCFIGTAFTSGHTARIPTVPCAPSCLTVFLLFLSYLEPRSRLQNSPRCSSRTTKSPPQPTLSPLLMHESHPAAQRCVR